jgi:hypothetical protein
MLKRILNGGIAFVGSLMIGSQSIGAPSHHLTSRMGCCSVG